MAEWFTFDLEDEAAIERLVLAWRDAPIENPEVCGLLLEVAREQVIAYAPAEPLVEVIPIPAPLTVDVDANGITGGVTVSRLVGGILAVAFDLDTDGAPNEPYFSVPLTTDPRFIAADSTLLTLGGGPTMQVTNDGYLTRAWGDWSAAAVATIYTAAEQIDPEPVEVVKARYVLAQLRQAQNLWDAGRASANGDVGAEGFVFQPRPLDKTIRGMIRPVDGKPHVL